MKRVVSVFLTIFFCFTCTISAFAEQNVMPYGEASSDLHRVEQNCIPDGFTRDLINDASYLLCTPASGRVEFEVLLFAKKVVEKLGFTNFYLQEWRNNDWVNVRTWSDNFLWYRDYFSFTKAIGGLVSGRYYRLRISSFYAENGIYYQTLQVTTPYIQCK